MWKMRCCSNVLEAEIRVLGILGFSASWLCSDLIVMMQAGRTKDITGQVQLPHTNCCQHWRNNMGVPLATSNWICINHRTKASIVCCCMLPGPSCRNIMTEQPGLKGLCPKSKSGSILIESNRLCMVVFQERAARVDSVTSITGWSLPSCKSMKGTCLSNHCSERWLEPSYHHQSIPTMFWHRLAASAESMRHCCQPELKPPLWWSPNCVLPHFHCDGMSGSPSHMNLRSSVNRSCVRGESRPIDPDWEGPAEYVLYDIICALGPVLSLACACIHSNWASLYKREQQISVGNKSLSVKRKNCKLHQSMAFPKLQITDLYKSSKSMRSNLDRSLTSPLAQVAEDGIGSTSSTMTRAGENKWEAFHRRGTTMVVHFSAR